MDKIIGRVASIWRYPVKSMAGETVEAIYVHETGLNGDRVYAFYDKNSRRKGLPCFTAREQERLLLLQPKITNEPDVTKQYPQDYVPSISVDISKASDEFTHIDITDQSLISILQQICAPRTVDIELDFRRTGIHDSKPISIMGNATIEQLSRETGIPLDARRFRENFYIDWLERMPFFEDSLVGKSLRIGLELVIHIVKRDDRCAIPCYDPETAMFNNNVLGVIAKNHENCAGVYAVVRKPGLINVGNRVKIVD